MPTRWLIWFGLWTILGLASGTQLHFASQRFAAGPHTWGEALVASLPAWYL
jgi:hypothetical protein